MKTVELIQERRRDNVDGLNPETLLKVKPKDADSAAKFTTLSKEFRQLQSEINALESKKTQCLMKLVKLAY